MAGALGPAAAAAGDFSGPVRFADSVLAARNHTGAACPCQGEWLGHPAPTPCFSGLFPACVLLPHLHFPLPESSPTLTLPFFQADGDRRTHSTLGPRGPVLGNPHAPLFLHHSLEPEAGGTLPSRLQPILLLDPSVSHAPLWTGESRCFSQNGQDLCTLTRASSGKTPLSNPSLSIPSCQALPPLDVPVSFRGSQGSFLTSISFFPVPGLGPLPFHFAQPLLTTERLSGSGLHRPLNRTRSEPLPPSATASPLLGPLQPRQDRPKPHVQLIKVRGTG